MALVLQNQTKLGERVTLLKENYNLHLTSRPEPVWRTLFHLPPDVQQIIYQIGKEVGIIQPRSRSRTQRELLEKISEERARTGERETA